MNKAQQKKLYNWYSENKRPLPWRQTQDPYKIWISEVMLQQTTVKAVLPYYKRFIKNFPNIKKLASSSQEELYENWSGLGYYSRARNLQRAAQEIVKLGYFPKTHIELLKLPGFGPYTSRAVSSIAFNEKVGALDGNVIRFLSRYHNLPVEWWRPSERQKLQIHADNSCQNFPSSDMSQALIEVGATICTASNPSCILCPVMKTCQGLKRKTLNHLPLRKPKRDKEIWQWQPYKQQCKNQLALVKNCEMPFLKGQWVFPGKVKKLKAKPKHYDFRHSITHHDIFVKIDKPAKSRQNRDCLWVKESEIKKINPASLLQKTLKHF